MSTASGWDDPAFEPPGYEPDPDVEYDIFCARVDAGKQCPTCRLSTGPITKSVAMGLPLFTCTCGTSWFDSVTQPALV